VDEKQRSLYLVGVREQGTLQPEETFFRQSLIRNPAKSNEGGAQ
jgi:hypothetical protein